MKAPAHALAEYFGTQGLGVWAAQTGWAISAAREPATPDTTITVYDTPGRAPALYEENLRRPSVQVRVRARSYPDAYTKFNDIVDALHAIIDQTIDGVAYVGVWMSSDIQSLGPDDNERFRLTANFQIMRQEA